MLRSNKSLISSLVCVFGLLAGGLASGKDIKVMLSGDQEVPPVKTQASGEATLTVADDGSVSGKITTKGIAGTMAHIHMAAAGANGPVIVKLSKDGDTYSVPAGTKLDADQLKALRAGGLYVNVHSAENKGGELRAQLP